MLFVTEGAVSKWERGVSYPDITLISDICRVLDITEHELITASIDTDARKMKHDWFFVVLAALMYVHFVFMHCLRQESVLSSVESCFIFIVQIMWQHSCLAPSFRQ